MRMPTLLAAAFALAAPATALAHPCFHQGAPVLCPSYSPTHFDPAKRGQPIPDGSRTNGTSGSFTIWQIAPDFTAMEVIQGINHVPFFLAAPPPQVIGPTLPNQAREVLALTAGQSAGGAGGNLPARTSTEDFVWSIITSGHFGRAGGFQRDAGDPIWDLIDEGIFPVLYASDLDRPKAGLDKPRGPAGLGRMFGADEYLDRLEADPEGKAARANMAALAAQGRLGTSEAERGFAIELERATADRDRGRPLTEEQKTLLDQVEKAKGALAGGGAAMALPEEALEPGPGANDAEMFAFLKLDEDFEVLHGVPVPLDMPAWILNRVSGGATVQGRPGAATDWVSAGTSLGMRGGDWDFAVVPTAPDPQAPVSLVIKEKRSGAFDVELLGVKMNEDTAALVGVGLGVGVGVGVVAAEEAASDSDEAEDRRDAARMPPMTSEEMAKREAAKLEAGSPPAVQVTVPPAIVAPLTVAPVKPSTKPAAQAPDNRTPLQQSAAQRIARDLADPDPVKQERGKNALELAAPEVRAQAGSVLRASHLSAAQTAGDAALYVATANMDPNSGQTQEYRGEVVRDINESKKRPLLGGGSRLGEPVRIGQ